MQGHRSTWTCLLLLSPQLSCIDGEPEWYLRSKLSTRPTIHVLERGPASRAAFDNASWSLAPESHEALPGDTIEITLDVLDPNSRGFSAGPSPLWIACPGLGARDCHHDFLNDGPDDSQTAEQESAHKLDSTALVELSQPENLPVCGPLGPSLREPCILGYGHTIPATVDTLSKAPQPTAWTNLLSSPYLTIPVLWIQGDARWSTVECAQQLERWLDRESLEDDYLGCRFELHSIRLAHMWRSIDAQQIQAHSETPTGKQPPPSVAQLLPDALRKSPPYGAPHLERLAWRDDTNEGDWQTMSSTHIVVPAETKLRFSAFSSTPPDDSYRYVPRRFIELSRDFQKAKSLVQAHAEVEQLSDSILESTSPLQISVHATDPDLQIRTFGTTEFTLESPTSNKHFILYISVENDHGGWLQFGYDVSTVAP